MVKLGQAAVPIDLMTYRPEDGQPSVFLLHEDRRQTMLAVFNWTGATTLARLSFADLKLRAGGSFEAYDVLDHNRPVPIAGGGMELANQALIRSGPSRSLIPRWPLLHRRSQRRVQPQRNLERRQISRPRMSLTVYLLSSTTGISATELLRTEPRSGTPIYEGWDFLDPA